MDSQVFIQLLCSWLALVNEARAQFRPLPLCRGGKGLLGSHSLFPNVSPAPGQVRKSGSELLFALFLWYFVVLCSHRNVWRWRIVVCSYGITHHGQHRSSWNTWGVHSSSQQWVQSAGYTSGSLMLGALNGSEKTENSSNLCCLPPGNVKVWEDGHLQQAKDRAVSFSSCQGCLHILRRGRGCLLCPVGKTVPSITYTKGIYYPWGLLWPLPGTGGLRIVSLCAASAPSSLLLMALGLLNGCWPSFWTLVVSRALVTRMELRTVYMHSETLLFIFWPWCLLMMIYFYLSERSVKIKWFRARALEEKLY